MRWLGERISGCRWTGSCCWARVTAPPHGAAAPRPNIVLLLTDGTLDAKEHAAITCAQLATRADAAFEIADDIEGATPREERVATLGLLNKRNNVSRDFEMKPGEATRVGDVVIRLRACEKTAPWELPQDEGAFVQVFVRERRGAPVLAVSALCPKV